MKNKFFLLLSFLLFFIAFSCKESSKDEEVRQDVHNDGQETLSVSDTLTYRSVHLEKRHAACDSLREEEADYCTHVSFTYIEVTKAPSTVVQKRINDSLFFNLMDRDSITDMESLQEGFIKEYELFLAEMKEAYEGEEEEVYVSPWSWEISQKVVNNTAKVFVVEQGYFIYQGGAHGSYMSDYLNFSPRTGKLLRLSDLIAVDKMDRFKEIGKKYFDLSVAEMGLIDEEFWFPESGFYLPEVFGLLPEGMTFVFGLYEIGPYAIGEIEFTIPYDVLGEVAKPYGVLDMLVKGQ